MHSLEDSLAIKLTGPGAGTAQADPTYEANTGMFGGWTAALLMKAVMGRPGREVSASTVTVNFVKRVIPGERLRLETRIFLVAVVLSRIGEAIYCGNKPASFLPRQRSFSRIVERLNRLAILPCPMPHYPRRYRSHGPPGNLGNDLIPE